MTTQADFTEEEWTRLKRAPFVAGMGVSLADPGGPIEAFHETAATLRAALPAADGTGRGELVDAISADLKNDAAAHHNPLSGFKPTSGGTAGVEILDELKAASQIVKDKGTPDDAATFDQWLLDVAQSAANAAKEGGFFGFHAVRVSEGEQKMLDSLSEALGRS
jgi:hypothetical protein